MARTNPGHMAFDTVREHLLWKVRPAGDPGPTPGPRRGLVLAPIIRPAISKRAIPLDVCSTVCNTRSALCNTIFPMCNTECNTMDIPAYRHPDCPDVHLGSCPTCKRLWERDARVEIERPSVSEAGASSVDVEAVAGSADVDRRSDLDGAVGDSEAPDVSTKAEKIDVAKKALSRAEISRRQREKDPEGYRKWNRERMRRRRKS